MGLHHRLARMERSIGSAADIEASARKRAREFVAGLQRDMVRYCPEYREVTREDCADDEEWNEIRGTIAIADGNEKEAVRLESLPAPRREAHRAWVAAAPGNAHQIARLLTRDRAGDAGGALAKARARTGIRGLFAA